ncbi:efflux RND transporter periplasmic adaptor subunit [Bacillus sp. NP157]|nr:efflux RND transporter periplasmic adaptor subunit [Bacillus sp. NP157]
MDSRLTAIAMAACLLLGACRDDSTDEVAHEVASAAVRLDTVRQGSLPRTVLAWGDAGTGATLQHAVALGVDGAFVSFAVSPGDAVHRQQLLGTFQLTANALAALRQARSALDAAVQSRDRLLRLRQDNLATDEQVAQAGKGVDDARATLATFPAGMGKDGRLALRAPEDGTVASIAVATGQSVPANAPLLMISPSQGVEVVGSIEPASAGLAAPGMPARLTPVAGGEVTEGRVTHVGRAIDPSTRGVPVQVQPAQPVMPGSTWRIEIVVGHADGWLVPADALVDEGAGRALFQVRRGKAHRVPVHVVFEEAGQAIVSGDVDPSEALVTVGAPQLAEGMTVVSTSEARR